MIRTDPACVSRGAHAPGVAPPLQPGGIIPGSNRQRSRQWLSGCQRTRIGRRAEPRGVAPGHGQTPDARPPRGRIGRITPTRAGDRRAASVCHQARAEGL
eukprot:1095231-Prymnesium_polylepis.1